MCARLKQCERKTHIYNLNNARRKTCLQNICEIEKASPKTSLIGERSETQSNSNSSCSKNQRPLSSLHNHPNWILTITMTGSASLINTATCSKLITCPCLLKSHPLQPRMESTNPNLTHVTLTRVTTKPSSRNKFRVIYPTTPRLTTTSPCNRFA